MDIRVITADTLSERDKDKIEKVFRAKHAGEEIGFRYELDKAVIGGLMIIDGDSFYDATLRRQLNNLKNDCEPSPATGTLAEAEKKARRARLKKLVEEPGGPEFEAIHTRLLDKIHGYEAVYDKLKAGRVFYSGDGVIRIQGLSSVKYDELLDANGVKAIALNLEENEVGAIVLDDEDKVPAGTVVRSTGRIVEVPVGEALLGRVISPLGEPMDGLGALGAEKTRPIEAPAPAIADRGKVNEPLQTGIMAIDAMIPIGRGQRELIIGDRQTGKTSIALDTIINQKGKDVYCVYVAIGQKASTVSAFVRTLNEYDAMRYTVIVCSTARDSSPMQYIAPYAGCAVAEEFMYAGKDVLIVYDDLSKHAVAYRAMSLLLKRPPGREAYSGDIFYLHSRLLERAAKLSDALGGGSMTALPIVETLAGDISAYVPTNIISITDGQIYLESELFNAGVRPALNVGLSVSRVGSSAQIKGMKKVSGKLRLDLSQYRELIVFTQFGSDLDAATQRMLDQGARATEMLKQDLNAPLDVEHQIILLYVTMKELLLKVPAERVSAFKRQFIDYLDTYGAHFIDEIRATGDLTMELQIDLEDFVEKFLEIFGTK